MCVDDDCSLDIASVMRRDDLMRRDNDVVFAWVKIPSGGAAAARRRPSVRPAVSSSSICMCARGDYEPARERAGVFRGELSVLQVLLAGAWCVRPAWTQLHLKLHTQLVAWISIICGWEAPPFFLEQAHFVMSHSHRRRRLPCGERLLCSGLDHGTVGEFGAWYFKRRKTILKFWMIWFACVRILDADNKEYSLQICGVCVIILLWPNR